MGRELRRVPLDFDWPIGGDPWKGFINEHYEASEDCPHCEHGFTHEYKALESIWYGHTPFKPEDRGSTPFPADHPAIMKRARWNVERTPEWYGTGSYAVQLEAERLAAMFNSQWCHHLNADDVAAVLEGDRPHDLTHDFIPGRGWVKKEPEVVVTPEMFNEWTLRDPLASAGSYTIITAECARLGVPSVCSHCEGEGRAWPSAEAKKAYDDWQPTPPPEGPGYQVWETVSEGSPISPVFSTPEALARHMTTTRWGADKGTSYEAWLSFIRGPGWAPSSIGMVGGGMVSGVEGLHVMEQQKAAAEPLAIEQSDE